MNNWKLRIQGFFTGLLLCGYVYWCFYIERSSILISVFVTVTIIIVLSGLIGLGCLLKWLFTLDKEDKK